MAEDIAPALLEQLRAAFLANLEGDKTAAQLLEKIQNSTANYEIAGNYAEQVGTALADAFSAVLTADALPDGRMYPNIAEKVIRPLLVEDHNLVAEAAAQVQTALNQAQNIGLKAQKLKLNEDRVDGLLKAVCSKNDYDEMISTLNEPVISFSRSVVDETLDTNMEFQCKSGLSPKIRRSAEPGACQYCLNRVGEKAYPLKDREIYKRHPNCRCTIEYVPGDGRQQNVHTKQWTNTQAPGKIKAGKTKYAPSPQRNQVKVQLPAKQYARLTGIFNTRYPGLTPEDGEVIIRDAKYGYKVVADGYGGFNTLYVWKLK